MISAFEDKQSPSLILWHLPVRHDLNQLSAFSVTLNHSSSVLKRIVWSIISKTAERAGTVSAATLPASIDDRISLWNLRKAVSVETSHMQTDNDWMCLNC